MAYEVSKAELCTASVMPVSPAASTTIQTSRRPSAARSAMVAISAPLTRSIASISRFRSSRSASAPAKGVVIRPATPIAMPTAASAQASCGCCSGRGKATVTSHTLRAKSVISVPSTETDWDAQRITNVRNPLGGGW